MSSNIGISDISDQDISIIDDRRASSTLVNFPPEILLHIRAFINI